MEIENDVSHEKILVKVNIQYDFLPSYHKKCKVQGHREDDCRVIQPELQKELDTREDAVVTNQKDQKRYKGAVIMS